MGPHLPIGSDQRTEFLNRADGGLVRSNRSVEEEKSTVFIVLLH
jgi:hypothetical protein